MTPLLFSAACAVLLVGEGDAFSDRVQGELASSLSCVDASRTFELGGHRTVVRIVGRRTVEVWEGDSLATVLHLDGDDAVDAVKLAEHVRARIAPMHGGSGASRSESADRPTSAASGESPAGPRFSIGAGIGPTVEAGAVGVGARVSLRARIVGPLGVGAMLVAPLVSASVSGPSGEAEIGTVAGGPTVDLELRPAQSSFGAWLGFGALLAHTRATGIGAAPFEGRRVSQTRFLPALAAGARYAVASRVSLELAGMLGIAVPSLDVELAGSPVGPWGAPYLMASAGVVVAF